MGWLSKGSLRRPRVLSAIAGVAGLGTLAAVAMVAAPSTALAQAPNSGGSSGGSPIVYVNPPKRLIPEGQALFAEDCETCHGVDAQGSTRAPNLQGLGAATVDFWITTGRMPLADPTTQAIEKPPRLTNQQAEAIASYIVSLAPGGPGIPSVNLKAANISRGEFLFSEDCAACHTITGVGDALANNVFAPSLYPATPTQVAEAIRTGPGNMPRFGPGTLSNQEVADVVRYVEYLHAPNDRGGAGLGHVGPVTEGLVAIVFGLGGLMVAGYWIGGRAPR
ncbi:c-type cytochrome [Acidimicrobium ferrooxidans]|uniref:cytochrome bc1 complex diheme cytochrome c subunit n=1 Tax=Acidimicrobium ferrooxidans TaxID=53635 RepID=UPI00117DDF8A|nr:c-type cytochrome [Acidimicrobium ferrooxidans]